MATKDSKDSVRRAIDEALDDSDTLALGRRIPAAKETQLFSGREIRDIVRREVQAALFKQREVFDRRLNSMLKTLNLSLEIDGAGKDAALCLICRIGDETYDYRPELADLLDSLCDGFQPKNAGNLQARTDVCVRVDGLAEQLRKRLLSQSMNSSNIER